MSRVKTAGEPFFGRQAWRLYTYLRPYKTTVIVGLILNGLARVCDLLPLALAGKVVDTATAGVRDPHTYVLFGLAVLGSFLCLALFQSSSDYALAAMIIACPARSWDGSIKAVVAACLTLEALGHRLEAVPPPLDRHRVFLDTNLGDYRGRRGGVR